MLYYFGKTGDYMNVQDFINELKKINIELSEEQVNQFNTYFEYLVEFNSHTNLTAITDKNEVYLKHFYDSLTLAKYVDLNSINTLVDVGTGAGFPGMVLKIAFPHLDITLLDSNNKKLKFLDDLIEKLNLIGIRTVHERAEEFVRNNNLDKYDLVTSRAVAALPVLTELCLPLVKVDGLFVALKGSAGDEELSISKNIIKKLNGDIIFNEKLSVVDNNDRSMIGIKKINKTPSGYPRDYGRIKKDYNRIINGNK